MAGDPSAEGGPHFGDAVRRRFPALRWVALVDDAVYAAERAFVTIAMLVMSTAVCVTVLFQFMAKQRAIVNRLDQDASVTALWPGLLVLAGVALVAHAALSRAPAMRANPSVVRVFTALTTAAFAAYCFALIAVPSHVVMAVTVLGAGLWATLAEFDAPRPITTDGNDRGRTARVAAAGMMTVAGTMATWFLVPERYSWTTKIALFLLLWTAFVGASMATHDGRHLKIDAIRKSIAPRLLPWYEALSHTTAALFTAGFTYLAWLYFKGRLPELPAPGEIPDWIKVLAIPIALALVTLRFAGRAISAALYGALGLGDEQSDGGPQ